MSALTSNFRFYWNNLSSANGTYIRDLSGMNFYNATAPSGANEGNIYGNVMDGSVQIMGNTASSGRPGLYIGQTGAGYPYNAANSLGKVVGNATDYAPLTPFQGCACGVLSTPGYVCNLTSDLSSNGTCFNVQANNVAIQCNGHSITGSGQAGEETYGVFSNSNATAITGCSISGFARGIMLENSTGSMVVDDNVSASTTAIMLYRSSGNSIIDSRAVSDGGVAVSLHTSPSNTVAGNLLSATSDNNLDILFGSDFNQIYNNTFVDPSNSSSSFAFYVNIGSIPTSYNNTFYWNNFSAPPAGSQKRYIYNLGPGTDESGNLFSANIGGVLEGNIYGNVMDGHVAVYGNISSAGFPSLYIGMGGAGVPYDYASSQGMISGFATDYAPLTPFQGCACGVLSTPGYVCNLTSDLSSNGTCFNVQANNVAIQCNGHSITGSGQAGEETYGVFSNSNATAITGCSISGFARGIMLENSTGSMVVDDNVSASTTAIMLYRSSGNSIIDSRAVSDGGVAVSLHTSPSNTVAGNLLSATSDNNLDILFGSDFNQIYNNTFVDPSNSSSSFAFYVNIGSIPTSYNNTFYWNNFSAPPAGSQKRYIYNLGPGTDESGNLFSANIGGVLEGNIYGNVMDGHVAVYGNISSAGFPSLYIGMGGAGVPYDYASSQGMISGFATDYAPLTSTIYSPPAATSKAADETALGTGKADAPSQDAKVASSDADASEGAAAPIPATD
jgi:hypothetical protein